MLVPKICGIKDINTLKYIISHEHYPKLVGMILNYEKSPRLISINKAKELTNLKGPCEYIGVLTSPISLDLLESIKDLNFSYYQIYDQTPEQIKNIKDQYNKKIILALTIKTAEDINQYKQWKSLNILGRVYLASEGINAQISIPENNITNFKRLISH